MLLQILAATDNFQSAFDTTNRISYCHNTLNLHTLTLTPVQTSSEVFTSTETQTLNQQAVWSETCLNQSAFEKKY